MPDQTYSFEVTGYGNMAQLESSIARAQERVAQAVTGIRTTISTAESSLQGMGKDALSGLISQLGQGKQAISSMTAYIERLEAQWQSMVSSATMRGGFLVDLVPLQQIGIAIDSVKASAVGATAELNVFQNSIRSQIATLTQQEARLAGAKVALDEYAASASRANKANLSKMEDDLRVFRQIRNEMDEIQHAAFEARPDRMTDNIASSTYRGVSTTPGTSQRYYIPTQTESAEQQRLELLTGTGTGAGQDAFIAQLEKEKAALANWSASAIKEMEAVRTMWQYGPTTAGQDAFVSSLEKSNAQIAAQLKERAALKREFDAMIMEFDRPQTPAQYPTSIAGATQSIRLSSAKKDLDEYIASRRELNVLEANTMGRQLQSQEAIRSASIQQATIDLREYAASRRELNVLEANTMARELQSRESVRTAAIREGNIALQERIAIMREANAANVNFMANQIRGLQVDQQAIRLATAQAQLNEFSQGQFALNRTRSATLANDIRNLQVSGVGIGTSAAGQDAWVRATNANNRFNESLENTNKVGNKVNQTFGRIYRTMAAFTAITAVIEIVRGLHEIASAAITYNEAIETSRVGIAALLAAQGQFVKANNEVVSGAEKFNASMKLSDDIINKLQYDNLKTAATFEQLVKAFQSAVAPGTAAGFNIDQIRKYNLAMVQTASAMGLPLDMLAEELRSMLRGTITPRNTIIATNLGITNEQIRSYKNDAQGLFDFIMGKLAEFNKYGDVIQNTFAGIKSNLLDVFKRAAGEGGKGFFDFLKVEMNKLIDFFAIIDEHNQIMLIRPEAINFMKNFFMEVQAVTEVVITLGKAFFVVLNAIAELNKSLASAWKPLGDMIDYYAERAKFVSQALKQLKKSSDEMMDLEDTNLGIAPSWSNTRLERTKPQIDLKQMTDYVTALKDINDQLEKAYSLSPDTKMWIPEDKSFMNSAEAVAYYASKLFDTKDALNKYSEAAVTASERAHEGVLTMTSAANAAESLKFSAYGAARSFNELAKAINEISGVNLIAFGRDLEKSLVGLDAKLAGIRAGLPNYAMNAMSTQAKRYEDIAKNWQVQMETPASALKSPESQANWEEVTLSLKRQKEMTDQEYWKLLELGGMQEGRKSTGGGGGPKIFETQTREIERIIADSNKKIYDLQSDYWMDMLKLSGDYYNAEEVNIQKFANNTRHEFEQTWMDLYTKAEVLTKRVQQAGDSKQGVETGTNEAVAQAWADLKKLTETYGILEPLLQKIVDLKRQENVASNYYTEYENVAKLNQEYANMVGNLQERAYWENYLLGIETQKKLAGAGSPEEKALIARNAEMTARRRSISTGDDFFAGFKQSADDYLNTLPKMGALGSQVFDQLTSSIDDASSSLADFCSTGQANFGDFARSVINNLLQMTIKMLMMKAVGSFIGLFSGGGSGVIPGSERLEGVGQWHSGGIVGSSSNIQRTVPTSLFFNAPRLHGGLNSDEFPAILQKGEAVIPKGSVGGTGGINTNISVTVNNTGGGTTNPKDMEMLGKKVAAAVKEEFNRNLRDNLRPGNMLNRGLR